MFSLDDHRPVVTPIESRAMFHEDEVVKKNFQVGLLVPSIDGDKVEDEEQ